MPHDTDELARRRAEKSAALKPDDIDAPTPSAPELPPLCTYCLAHSGNGFGIVSIDVPFPTGEVKLVFCQRHLDQFVAEITGAQHAARRCGGR